MVWFKAMRDPLGVCQFKLKLFSLGSLLPQTITNGELQWIKLNTQITPAQRKTNHGILKEVSFVSSPEESDSYHHYEMVSLDPLRLPSLKIAMNGGKSSSQMMPSSEKRSCVMGINGEERFVERELCMIHFITNERWTCEYHYENSDGDGLMLNGGFVTWYATASDRYISRDELCLGSRIYCAQGSESEKQNHKILTNI
ncbi:unnamed protein product [Thlaspi arvense]|uniref:Uncharacterized protein n=1 Tax=Thlaspi arvense TaxID=13288 RepID=A0AAU9T4Y8_THLAR|nr:unnamed protein product [Thlaspi arvense]